MKPLSCLLRGVCYARFHCNLFINQNVILTVIYFFKFLKIFKMIDIDLLIHGIEKEKCLPRTNISSYVDKHSKQKSWFKFY